MPTARCEPLDVVLPTARGERGDTGVDAPYRRVVPAVPVLRQPSDGTPSGARGGGGWSAPGAAADAALEAIYRKPRTSVPNPEHRVYPYLLRGLTATESGLTSPTSRCRAGSCTWWRSWTGPAGGCWRGCPTRWTPMRRWKARHSRDLRSGQPVHQYRVHGIGYTSSRCLDNVFIERLWRSLKHEVGTTSNAHSVDAEAYRDGLSSRASVQRAYPHGQAHAPSFTAA